MTDQGSVIVTSLTDLSPAVQPIIKHLCESECHAYGSVLQWCETRGDCVYAVVCPGCEQQFLLDEHELVELERWTEANGSALVCGVAL